MYSQIAKIAHAAKKEGVPFRDYLRMKCEASTQGGEVVITHKRSRPHMPAMHFDICPSVDSCGIDLVEDADFGAMDGPAVSSPVPAAGADAARQEPEEINASEDFIEAATGVLPPENEGIPEERQTA